MHAQAISFNQSSIFSQGSRRILAMRAEHAASIEMKRRANAMKLGREMAAQ